jgi:hypothetical protein
VVVRLDCGGFEAKIGGVGDAPDRDQDLGCLYPLAARQRRDHAVALVRRDRFDFRSRPHVNTEVVAQGLGYLLARERFLTREQVIPALDQGDFGAEAGPGLRQLTANRAAAEDDHARRHFLRGRRRAVVPGRDSVEAVDRRHRRLAAGGDDDCPLGDEGLVADPDPPLALEAGVAAEEIDSVFFQPRQLNRVVEIVDHLVAAVENHLWLQLAPSGGDAGDALGLAEHVGRPQQRLRRHAGVVGAFAADQVALDDRHPPPRVRQSAGADLA